MNYSKLYDNLINSAKTAPKPDVYKETHHIMPLCIGGSDDNSNLVALTARQHYLAHWLLYKIHRTTKLVYAWHGMSRIGKGQDARRRSSNLFEYAKVARSKHLSESSKGEDNWFYGKKHSKESIDKMVESRRITYERDPERHAKQLNAYAAGVSKRWKGVPKSPESNAKRGRRLKMLKHKITGECIRIPLEVVMDDNWANPYSLREKIIGLCPHCGKTGELNSTFKRWHFDRCKQKSS